MIAGVPPVVPFRLVESRDPDGRLRIALQGELDVVVADQLSLRLNQLIADRTPVHVDLTELSFIDSSGIRTLIAAVQNGGELMQIGREVRPNVQVTLDLLGIAPVIWPQEPGAPAAPSHRPSSAETAG